MLPGITHKHQRGVVNNSRARAEALPTSSKVPMYLRCNRRSLDELSARPATPGGTGRLDRSALSFRRNNEIFNAELYTILRVMGILEQRR